MTEFLDYLRSIYPLSDAAAAAFDRIMRPLHIPKKDFLVKAGSINDKLFFIRKGLVRCYYIKTSPKGKKRTEVSNWFLSEGDTIASMQSFLAQQPTDEYMQALEDCELLYSTFPDLLQVYNQFPEVFRHSQFVTQKYSTLWHSLLKGIRMQTAEERYQFLLDKFPALTQRVPARYLASYLDVTEVTLSRIRNKRAFFIK
jgi:CRP-like cAMP-binding protein